MSTMDLRQLGLKPALVKDLGRKARQAGKSRVEYARYLIERGLLAEETFADLVRPIRDDIKKRGVTPDQLDEIVNRARKATSPRRRRVKR